MPTTLVIPVDVFLRVTSGAGTPTKAPEHSTADVVKPANTNTHFAARLLISKKLRLPGFKRRGAPK